MLTILVTHFPGLITHIKHDKYILTFLFFVYVFIIIVAPQTAMYDVYGFFLPWIKSFLTVGLPNVYKDPLINYPPLTIYVMYFYGMAVTLLHLNLDKAIYYFRDIIFLFDLATFYLFIKIGRHFKRPTYFILFFVGNIAILYNTVFWGQLDAIYTFFIAFSVFSLLKKRPILSVIGLLLALASKPQALLFAPPLFLLWIPYYYKNVQLLTKTIFIGLASLLVIFAPFLLSGTIGDFLQIVKRTTDYYPFVSMNAFNFWLFMFGIDHITKTSDSLLFLGISLRNWGFIMFSLLAMSVLYPMYRIVKMQIKYKHQLSAIDWQSIALSLTLIAVIFFFFNTQMHERYAHAALILVSIYTIISGRFLLYILLSVAYLANLTFVYNSLAINPSLFISPFTVALLYGVILVYGIVELYYLLFIGRKRPETHVLDK